MVRKKRPRRILELGTGIGTATAVLALASPDADIISFEQEEKCVAIARKIIPHHLQSRVTVLYSPLFVFSLPAISPYLFFSGYRDISLTEDFFDFVVIDGPASWMEKGKLITLMNGDIIPILPLLLPGALVYIDHRKDVSSFCKRFLSLYLSLLAESEEYSVFMRSREPLARLDSIKIIDKKLQKKKSRGYEYANVA